MKMLDILLWLPNFTQTFFVLITAFPCILQYHLLLYIIVIGGDHSIPSSMETRSPCSFPDMISRNSRIDREDLANTMSDRMHRIRSYIHSIPTEKATDDNHNDNDDDDDSYL